MSDLKRKRVRGSPLSETDDSLLWEAPWLDSDTALEVMAAAGGKPMADLMGTPAEQKEHLKRVAETLKQAGKRGFQAGYKRPAKSLQWLAQLLGKDARTVRRYCELGLVPGAWRTTGGHWRVRRGTKTVKQVRRAIEAFARRSKTAWERKAEKGRRRTERTAKAVHVAYTFARTAGLYTDKEFARNAAIPEKAKKAGSEPLQRRTLLFTAAQVLRQTDSRIPAGKLASLLGVSRATLFRRYSAKEIKEARLAAQPS